MKKENVDKIPTRYDCPYLDCDSYMHMNQCLKKHTELSFLRDAFEKAKFNHSNMNFCEDTACNNCNEMFKKHKGSRIPKTLVRKIKSYLKQKYASSDSILKKYRQMKNNTINYKLKKIEEYIQEIRELLYEE